MTEMHYWSIRELSQRIRSGEISPVAVVRTLLDRIEALDGRLHSYITVMGDQSADSSGRRNTTFVGR